MENGEIFDSILRNEKMVRPGAAGRMKDEGIHLR
jgi:hypothetical protein